MITGVNHLTLAVRDIEESFTFYHDVLGFTPIQKSPISAYLLAGEMWIALTLDAYARHEPLPEYTHIAFTVALADFGALKARLIQAGVQATAASVRSRLERGRHPTDASQVVRNPRIAAGSRHCQVHAS